jgi:hypothetical protein
MAAIFPLKMTKNAIKTLFFKILLRYFQNSNGKFSGSMVVIRKKILGQKIYFRFGRKNSKWFPKTGFSSIKRELVEIFSKFEWQIFRFDGSDS